MIRNGKIMKTMQDYTNYCTEEHTIRAHKLGAPIFPTCYADGLIPQIYYNDITNTITGKSYYDIPTTQQMIGWLEEQQDIRGIEIYRDADGDYSYDVLTEELNRIVDGGYYDSKKQAELAAIDAAFDYLEKGGTK